LSSPNFKATNINGSLDDLCSSVLLPSAYDVIIHLLVFEQLGDSVHGIQDHATHHPSLERQGEVLQVFCE